MNTSFCGSPPISISPGPRRFLCAGITTYSPHAPLGCYQGQKRVGVVGLGGLGHMAVKFARAFGAHVVVFTTSPHKKDDALRLGAHEVVISRNADEMKKHAGSFDFILDAVSAEHDINAYISLLARDGNITLVGVPREAFWRLGIRPHRGPPQRSPGSHIGGIARNRRRCSISAARGTLLRMLKSSPFKRSTKPTKDCSRPM